MLIDNELYLNDIKETANTSFLDWEQLKNKTILLTGVTGLVGRYFADLIMYKNLNDSLNCTIIGISRNDKKIKDIFNAYLNNKNFKYYAHDVSERLNCEDKIDFIIHCASNTHPLQYATDPIGTILTNTWGTKNLLDLSVEKNVNKFLFVSSFEVNGKIENKDEIFENDFGSINCTTLRNCYPESKRISESLCIAFSEQKNVNVSIVRLARVFGPTMSLESSLATASFLKNGINKEDIVLKSDGTQYYSYNYVSDAVTAILTVLLNGNNKEAYNVSDKRFDSHLKDFAEIIADYTGNKVVFDLPNEIEKKGFSNAVMSILNSNKLQELGWKANKDLKTRIQDTIDIMKG